MSVGYKPSSTEIIGFEVPLFWHDCYKVLSILWARVMSAMGAVCPHKWMDNVLDLCIEAR